MDNFSGKRVWIIGASSGIGAALAREVTAQGGHVVLSARSEDKLHDLAADIGGAHVVPCDVADGMSVEDAAAIVFAKDARVDSIVHLAALYDPMAMDQLDIAKTRSIIDVNVMGSFHVVHAVLPYLNKQGGGQLVLCGSVAGYCGLPYGQPYSATKAAVINLAQSLRSEKQGKAWDIKVINPGFVRTPLTEKNDFDMPMILEPEDAAKALAKGLLRRGFEVHFPKRFTLFVKLLSILPDWLYFKIGAKIKQKKDQG